MVDFLNAFGFVLYTPKFVLNSVVEEKHNFMYDYYHFKLEVFQDIVFRYMIID